MSGWARDLTSLTVRHFAVPVIPMATSKRRLGQQAKAAAARERRGLAFHKRMVREMRTNIAVRSPQTPRGPRYQVIAATIPLTEEDLRLACVGGQVLPLGPLGLDPLRLVTIVGPYGQYVGSGELAPDEYGFVGVRILSLTSHAMPDQVRQPDRGWPEKPA